MDIDITDMDIRTGMDVDYNMGGMFNNERKLAKFLIMFDNSNLLYFPGQFLSGRVIVELADEMAITGRRGFISSIFRFLCWLYSWFCGHRPTHNQSWFKC